MKKCLLLVLAYALMMTVWAVSNSPGTAPDEYAHYLRALGAGRGDLVLTEKPPPLAGANADKPQLRWQRRQSRVVEVAAPFSAEMFNCERELRPQWGCPDPPSPSAGTEDLVTWVATYPPYIYVVPGLSMALAGETGAVDGAVEALVVGRLGSMAMVLALVAAAIFLLYDRRVLWLSHLGLMAAITPMVVFVGSSLSSSGPEIAAGAAFSAGLLRLTRFKDPEDARPGWPVWLTTGFSAAVLMLSRDLGIAWAGLHVLITGLMVGVRPLLTVVRRGGYRALTGIAVGACGLLGAAFWQLRHQVRPGLDLSAAASNLKPAMSITKEIGRQQIGVFGHIEVFMSPVAYVAWGTVLAALGVAALVVGRFRERLALLLAIAAGLLVPVMLEAVQVEVGFGAQGRHILPFTVAIPLLAGEILTRHADELQWLRKVRPALWVSAVAGTVLGYSWYLNSKWFLVGIEGRDPFWAFAPGEPPVAWEVLAFAMIFAVCVMTVFGYLASRSGFATRGST